MDITLKYEVSQNFKEILNSSRISRQICENCKISCLVYSPLKRLENLKKLKKLKEGKET